MLLRSDIERFFNQVLDVLLPRTCLVCSALSDVEICQSCKQTIRIQPKGYHHLPELSNVVAFFPYEGVLKNALHRLKFESYDRVGLELGSYLAAYELNYELEEYDMVIPVPLDYTRLRQRQFNQVTLIMKPLIDSKQIGTWSEVIFRAKATQALHAQSKAERATTMQNAFWLDPTVTVSGKKILIVDDIVTTGSTMIEMAKLLSDHGASDVQGLAYSYA